MPKKPKPHSKGQNKPIPKKAKPKAQRETVSILKSKYYWATLTLLILVLTIAVGIIIQISIEKELLMLGTIFSVLGFAFYVGFKSSHSYSKRATFIFVGASVIGFIAWVAMVFSFNAVGIISQVASLIGVEYFAITTLTIFLVFGAFIGDLIGKNRETVMSLAYELRDKIRK